MALFPKGLPTPDPNKTGGGLFKPGYLGTSNLQTPPTKPKRVGGIFDPRSVEAIKSLTAGFLLEQANNTRLPGLQGLKRKMGEMAARIKHDPTLPEFNIGRTLASATGISENLRRTLGDTESVPPAIYRYMDAAARKDKKAMGEATKEMTDAAIEANLLMGLSGPTKFAMTEKAARKILKLGNKPVTPEIVDRAWKDITIKTYPRTLKQQTAANVGSQKLVTEARDFLKGRLVPAPPLQLGKPIPAQVAPAVAKPIPTPETLKNTPKFKRAEPELTSKILTDLEGKTTVSKQYILDATNRPELKQAERDLFRRLLEDEGNQVDVPQFIAKAKEELTPLSKSDLGSMYEGINLPDNLRGKVRDYGTIVYESPVKTSAGEIHFSTGDSFRSGRNVNLTPNYFAHIRYEELPKATGTRRVIELQSDLFQKGGLESEFSMSTKYGNKSEALDLLPRPERDEYYDILTKLSPDNKDPNLLIRAKELEGKARELYETPRRQERAKLEPYRNTWQDRIIREEVRRAAKDGIKKLQFPTGETAMKIEGLGETDDAFELLGKPTNGRYGPGVDLTTANMKIGAEILDRSETHWIITDVLGDGKFKAVPKIIWDGVNNPDATYGSLSARAIKQTNDEILNSAKEQFDISGSVDKDNPIYKFYEKEVARYLKNKYDAKLVTDKQGVTWFEVDIKPEHKGAVEAFKKEPTREDAKYDRTHSEVSAEVRRILGRDVTIQGELIIRTPDGGLALGKTADGVITLLTKGGKFSDAVAKHEVGHFFEKYLATPEELKQMKSLGTYLQRKDPEKTRKLIEQGYEDDEIAMEFFNDELARYYATGKTWTEKIKIFFDKILQRVKLFFDHKTELLDLFRNIKKRGATAQSGELKPAYKRADEGKPSESPNTLPVAEKISPEEWGAIGDQLMTKVFAKKDVEYLRETGQYEEFRKAVIANRIIENLSLEAVIKAAKQGKNILGEASNDVYRILIMDAQPLDRAAEMFSGLDRRTILVQDKSTGEYFPEMKWMQEYEAGFNIPKDEWQKLPIEKRAELEAQFKVDNFYQSKHKIGHQESWQEYLTEFRPLIEPYLRDSLATDAGKKASFKRASKKEPAQMSGQKSPYKDLREIDGEADFQRIVEKHRALQEERADVIESSILTSGGFEVTKKFTTAGMKEMWTMLRSLVPWNYMGGKQQMYGPTVDILGVPHRNFKNLRPYSTTHLDSIKRVYDVFGGSGQTTAISMKLFKGAKHSIGDFDPKVAEYYDVLAKSPKEVKDYLRRLDMHEAVQAGFAPKQRFEELTATDRRTPAFRVAELIYDSHRSRVGQGVSAANLERAIQAVDNASLMFKQVTHGRANALDTLDMLERSGGPGDFVWIDPPYLKSTGYTEGSLFESHKGFMSLLDRLPALSKRGVTVVSYNADPAFVARREIAKVKAGSGAYGKLSVAERENKIKTLKYEQSLEEEKLAELVAQGLHVLRFVRPKGGAGGRTEIIITNSPWIQGTKLLSEVEEKVKMLFDKGYVTGDWTSSTVISAIKEQIIAHPDNFLPAAVLEDLEKISKKPLSELTPAELQTVLQQSQYLEHLYRTENRIYLDGQMVKLQDVVDIATSQLTPPAKIKTFKGVTDGVQADINLYQGGVKLGLWEKTKLYHLDQETLVEIMSDPSSMLYKILYKDIDRGVDAQYAVLREWDNWWKKNLAESKIDIEKMGIGLARNLKNVEWHNVPLADGKTIKLTSADKIALYLNSLNPDNVAHLIEGGFRLPEYRKMKFKTQVQRLSYADLGAIERSLTPDERKVAGWIKHFYNYMNKATINGASQKIVGYDIAIVPDYYPISTSQLDLNKISNPGQDFVQNILESFGFLKERTGGATTPIVLNDPFLTMYRMVNDSARFHGLALPVRNARALLNNKEFATTILNDFGNDYMRHLGDFLDTVEQSHGATKMSLFDLDLSELSRMFRSRVTQSILGANVGTVIIQPLSYLRAYNLMPAVYLNKHLSPHPIPSRVYRDMVDYQPQLWHRLTTGHISRDIGELGVQAEAFRYLTGKHIFDIGEKGMEGIRRTDYNTLGRIWMATEDWVRATTSLEGTEFKREVAKRAWEIIRRSQQSVHAKDLSVVARSSNPLVQLATMFSSENNKTYNILMRSAYETARTIKRLDPKASGYWSRVNTARAKHLGTIALALLVPALAITARDQGRRKLRKRKDQTPFQIALSAVGYMLNTFYGAGQVWDTATAGFYGRQADSAFGSNALVQTLDETIKFIASVPGLINDYAEGSRYKSGEHKGELRWQVGIRKAMRTVLDLVSRFTGIPTYAPIEDISGLVKWASGDD